MSEVRELESVSNGQLVELFEIYTNIYATLIIEWDFDPQEYRDCKNMLNKINQEISLRELEFNKPEQDES